MAALFCDIFLAKPILNQAGMTEIELFNEIMHRTGVMSKYESTFRYINASIPSSTSTDPKTRPGYILAQQGATAKYPVVMVPGFITSNLELWAGEDCAKRHFRQNLWGSLPIFVQSCFTDIKCWQRHLALDPFTGGDPKNIKLRSAQGFEAADYFMSTYWVWDRLIINLSDVGYDSSNMIMMAYDWRLSFPMLEQRDGYLTKLKVNIEAMVKTTGMPVVLTSHSMGSQIVLYFFSWVTTDEKGGGGGGGHDWVEKNIHSFVNIAGPLLGVPKAVTSLLSGEMKDTAVLMGPMGTMVERYFGRKDRKDLWTTWGSLWEMLPKGGDAIWGTSHDILTANSLTRKASNDASTALVDDNDNADDDERVCTKVVCPVPKDVQAMCTKDVCPVPKDVQAEEAFGSAPFITFTEDVVTVGKHHSDYHLTVTKSDQKEWTITDALTFLKDWGGGHGHDLHASKSINAQTDSQLWNDPTVTPLPHAPSMKVYCMYGIGIETERSYFYKRIVPTNDDSLPLSEHLPFIMDSSVNDPAKNIKYGTRSSDGDVSVPLLSLGYLCVDKWKTSSYLNPSGIDVITREYANKDEFQVNDPMRGGPSSSNHVDILGNADATIDLLKIVTGFQPETVKDKIVSDIEVIARRISSNPLNTIGSKRDS